MPKKKSRRDPKKRYELSPAVKKLTCEELEHFMNSKCEDEKCRICLKVWKAYGGETIKLSFKKKNMGEDTKSKLFRE